MNDREGEKLSKCARGSCCCTGGVEIERFLTLNEIAELSGLSARALADAARADKFVTYKVHGKRVAKWSDFEEYMKQFRSAPTPAKPKVALDPNERWLRNNERYKLRKIQSRSKE